MLDTSHSPSRAQPVAFMFLCALALAAPAGPRDASAGNQVWTGSSPRAKSIEAIARDPLNPSRAWAGAFGSGVFRTTDGGLNWTAYRSGLSNTFVRCLAVQPYHPDSVYCGTNDGVFLSVDGGINWNRLLSTSVSVRALAIHPVRTGILYAGTYGNGIFKSLNAGKNWSAVNLGLVNTSVRDIAFHPAKPETLLAATGTGGGIHRSFNGGLTWAQVPDTAANQGAIEQIQYDRLNPLRVYAATVQRGCLKSADGGNTWVRINRGLPTLRTRAIAVADTLRYLATDGQGVFFTTLSDSTWRPVNTGVTSLVVDALSAPSASPRTCWAGTDGGGIFSTANAGGSWTRLDGGLLSTLVFSLAVEPATHAVYAGLGFGDQFWASGDAGTSWTRASALVSHDSEHGVVADPLLSATVYLTSYGSGVLRSDDGGATWFDPDQGLTLTNRFVRDIVAWPGQSGHLFTGTGAGPFESTDGGASWSSRRGNLPASFSVRALALVPGAPPTLLVGNDSTGVWRSTDGGGTWLPKNVGMPVAPALFIHALHVDVTNSLIVYAATDSGVYKSTNRGDNWARASTGLPPGDALAVAQDPVHPLAIFCAVYGAGVFQSLDGGGTWFALFGQAGLGDLGVRSLAVDGALRILYAGTENGVAALSNYDSGTVGVEAGASPLAFSVWPNPVRSGPVTLHFALARPGRVGIAVYGVAGQRVRVLEDRVLPSGSHAFTWDARDERGRALAPGLYFVRFEGPDGVRGVRIALLGR